MRTLLLCAVASALFVGCGDDDRPSVVRDSGMPGTDSSMPGLDSGPPGCTPGQYACAGSTRYLCADDGVSRLNEEVCPAACSPTEGCVACMPGQRRCDGNVSMVCSPDGTGFVTGRDCAEFGSTCGASGFCSDACAEAESTRSNIGCEYWPVAMPNVPGLQGRYDFRVVIANPDTTAANVRIFRGSSMVSTVTVPAQGLQDVVLPWVTGLSDGLTGGGTAWTSLSVSNGAYRLLSDRPVTVAQFNPFEYDNGEIVDDIFDPNFGGPDYSYTNDASLLLPAHSFTGNYIGSSFVPLSSSNGLSYGKWPGYLTVVGITPEPTAVSIALSSAIAADPGGRFGAASRGQVINFTLQRGDVVVVAAAAPPNCTSGRPGYMSDDTGVFFCNEAEFDLSGSRITADRPIAAFGGHACAYVPYNAQACDHIESQLPPLETWGTNFNSAPMADPSGDAVNVVRVTAAFDDTSVTVSPAQGGVSTLTLGAGQWREFTATSAFQVAATRGVMVTQFLIGQYGSSPEADRGDPAMVILPPREQFRRDYTFVAPTSYNASTEGQNYILVVRSPGQNITLDGSPINPTWSAAGEREVGIVQISGGTHRMESTDIFGVLVFGMGVYTSYAYPAGLNLEEILLI